jgi:nucleoside-diphosphate-sugar epimerase
VHVSSSSVYGLGLGRPVDESFPLAPFPDPYPVTKAESDAAVQRMIARHRLPAVIIRPDQVFGPGDSLHFGRMAARLQRGRGFIVGSGHNRLPMVYVADLVQALLLALDRDEAVGQAYNIGTDRPLTQRQFLTAIAAEVGARPVAVHVPFHVLYAAGYVAERLAAGGRRPPVTRLGVAFIGTDNRYSIGKAERELDYVPQVPLAEGVRLAAAWYAGSRGEPADGRSQAGQPLRHSVTAQVRS